MDEWIDIEVTAGLSDIERRREQRECLARASALLGGIVERLLARHPEIVTMDLPRSYERYHVVLDFRGKEIDPR